MRTCTLCHFSEIPEDDVAIPFHDGRCICLRCFRREVADEKATSSTAVRQAESITPTPPVNTEGLE